MARTTTATAIACSMRIFARGHPVSNDQILAGDSRDGGFVGADAVTAVVEMCEVVVIMFEQLPIFKHDASNYFAHAAHLQHVIRDTIESPDPEAGDAVGGQMLCNSDSNPA